MLEINGIKNVSSEYIKSTIGRPIKEVFSSLTGSDDLAEKLTTEFREHLAEEGYLRTEIFPGILESFELLRNKNVKIALATNKNTWLAKKVINSMNIEEYFDLVVGQDLAKPKPSPLMLLRIMEELDSEMIAYCGDTEDDVMAANAANVKAIAIANSRVLPRNLQNSKTDYLLNYSKELPYLIKKLIK